MTLVIAIDGPSGSGKSSTSRGVARRLGVAYLDTGAMYRAMTWALQRREVDVNDAEQVARACTEVRIESGADPLQPVVCADGIDVTGQIRSDEVTGAVSAVSAVPRVREELVRLQQKIIADSDGIVVEGRDIASVVAPDADVKIYLVAAAASRAARRAAETGVTDTGITTEQLAKRDHVDSTRAASPMEMPVDARVIDNTDMSLDDVIEHIVSLTGEDR